MEQLYLLNPSIGADGMTKAWFLGFLIVVLLVLGLMIANFGLGTVIKCSSIESIPTDSGECWNPVPGTINVE